VKVSWENIKFPTVSGKSSKKNPWFQSAPTSHSSHPFKSAQTFVPIPGLPGPDPPRNAMKSTHGKSHGFMGKNLLLSDLIPVISRCVFFNGISWLNPEKTSRMGATEGPQDS